MSHKILFLFCFYCTINSSCHYSYITPKNKILYDYEGYIFNIRDEFYFINNTYLKENYKKVDIIRIEGISPKYASLYRKSNDDVKYLKLKYTSYTFKTNAIDSIKLVPIQFEALRFTSDIKDENFRSYNFFILFNYNNWVQINTRKYYLNLKTINFR